MGDVVAESAGVLIGGMLSRVAAAFAPGADEARWDSLPAAERARAGAEPERGLPGFAFAGWTDAELFARARYVDDTVLISAALCRG